MFRAGSIDTIGCRNDRPLFLLVGFLHGLQDLRVEGPMGHSHRVISTGSPLLGGLCLLLGVAASPKYPSGGFGGPPELLLAGVSGSLLKGLHPAGL